MSEYEDVDEVCTSLFSRTNFFLFDADDDADVVLSLSRFFSLHVVLFCCDIDDAFFAVVSRLPNNLAKSLILSLLLQCTCKCLFELT